MANAYLIFGSAQVNSTTIADFLSLPPSQRAMTLSQLGSTNQTNPLTNNTGFNFNGITFSTPVFVGSQLGYSVAAAGDVNGDGYADFIIGAPNISDPNNPLFNSAGAAFLVYGSPTLATRVNKTIQLDTPNSYTDQSIITFTTGQVGARTGQSVAGIGAFLNSGGADIAIGAPGATINATQGGAVFVVPNSFINLARTQTVDLLTDGQTGGISGGVIFAGSNATGGAGFSVAGGGNIDASSPATSDLLIGAPDSINGFNSNAVGPGRAFLVYGGSSLPGQAIVGSDGIAAIQLSRVGASTATTDIAGAVFVGDNTGDMTGYSVSTAGDFNGDGVIDFLIGSPGWNNNAGRADLFYGSRSSPNPPGPIEGTFVISDLVSAGASLFELDGSSSGQLVGYSVASAGLVNTDNLNDILVGAPGYSNSAGEAVLIPGNAALYGAVGLASVQNSPVQATVFRSSSPAGAAFVGASVSGNSIFVPPSNATVDNDGRADFLIGAPNTTYSSSLQSAGTAYLMEGALVPLATPVVTTITSPIGVGGYIAPYVINATTPADLQIYILSSPTNTTGFNPVTDINPSSITVNGVALPDPTTYASAGDVNGDGIPDAVFTFSPRTLLNLPNGTVTFTVSARTSSTGNFPNQLYSGSASVTVVGGTGGGTLPQALPPAFGGLFQNYNAAAPQYGEALLPSLPVVNQPSWKALPPRLAYRQFMPQSAFGYRLRNWAHPGLLSTRHVGRTIGGVPESVFTQSRFPKGVHFGVINHHGPTIGGATSSRSTFAALFAARRAALRGR